MVNVSKRMRKLQTALLSIRVGPGAVILPKEIHRIDMRFAGKINGGHMGPRKFWREELRRLKFHNPAVSMHVEQTDLAEDPAVMSIHYGSDAARSNTESSADSPGRVEQINMKNFTNSEILSALVTLTKAYPVEPTPDDIELGEKLEEQRIRSEREIELSAKVRAKARRERELLEQAKGMV